MNFIRTIIIKREEEWFVATCLENNIASQGKTKNLTMYKKFLKGFAAIVLLAIIAFKS